MLHWVKKKFFWCQEQYIPNILTWSWICEDGQLQQMKIQVGGKRLISFSEAIWSKSVALEKTEVDSVKESAETNCFPLQKHFPAEIVVRICQAEMEALWSKI